MLGAIVLLARRYAYEGYSTHYENVEDPVMIRTKGPRSNEGITTKEMELIEFTRNNGSWERYQLHLKLHWHLSTIYNLAESLVAKGYLKDESGSYSLGERADLVRNYRVLHGVITARSGDVGIRTMDVNEESSAEYRTSDGDSGPIGHGTPNWFAQRANQGPVQFRSVKGTPVLDITYYTRTRRPIF